MYNYRSILCKSFFCEGLSGSSLVKDRRLTVVQNLGYFGCYILLLNWFYPEHFNIGLLIFPLLSHLVFHRTQFHNGPKCLSCCPSEGCLLPKFWVQVSQDSPLLPWAKAFHSGCICFDSVSSFVLHQRICTVKAH